MNKELKFLPPSKPYQPGQEKYLLGYNNSNKSTRYYNHTDFIGKLKTYGEHIVHSVFEHRMNPPQPLLVHDRLPHFIEPRYKIIERNQKYDDPDTIFVPRRLENRPPYQEEKIIFSAGRLRTTWTVEMSQDLMAYYAIDAEAELASRLLNLLT